MRSRDPRLSVLLLSSRTFPSAALPNDLPLGYSADDAPLTELKPGAGGAKTAGGDVTGKGKKAVAVTGPGPRG